MDALVKAGLSDVHVVESQFAPDPDFPTVAFPNPEEPGAVDALLNLASDVDAEIAIALDPDADRCAIGVPTPDGWRMLSGDETGWLLGDYILSQIEPGPVSDATVVASTVVSSRMLAAIADDHGARHVETLTGFKWLSRADEDLPGCTLVYAYEEAIGHCVDPGAVRDKDGISAAVLACDLVAALRDQGRTVLDALDELARRHGVHTTTAVSRRVADADEAEAVMARLRTHTARSAGRLRGDGDRSAACAGTSAHRRARLLRWRRRQLGPDSRTAIRHRAKAQVLHRGSLLVHQGISRRREPRRARLRTSWPAWPSVSNAARTADPRRRRDPARCRRCR